MTLKKGADAGAIQMVDEVRERRLRREANQFGYEMRRNKRDDGEQTYIVIATGLSVPFATDWTLDQIQEWLEA